MPDDAIDEGLRKAAGGLPRSEERPSQLEMARAVASSIREQRHLIVQAGTGTGKSLAYLVPALVLGTRVVVSTATKALQDQLAQRDLPLLVRQLDERVEFAVLKGRSNYACAQRVREIAGGDQPAPQQEDLLGTASASSGTPASPSGWSDGSLGTLGREVRRLVMWAGGTRSAVTGRSWPGSRATQRGRR